jgi:hypothetical protein
MNPETPRGRVTLFSEDGEEIGMVAAYHVAAHAGVPVFAQLDPGAGAAEGPVVPILHAVVHASGLAVPYSGAQIRSAPQASGRAMLTGEMLRNVVTHYDLEREVVPGTPPATTVPIPLSPGPDIVPTVPPKPIPIPLSPGPDIVPAYVDLPMRAEG